MIQVHITIYNTIKYVNKDDQHKSRAHKVIILSGPLFHLPLTFCKHKKTLINTKPITRQIVLQYKVMEITVMTDLIKMPKNVISKGWVRFISEKLLLIFL